MARPRGFIPNYTPRSSAGLLEQVQQVLANAQTNQPTPSLPV